VLRESPVLEYEVAFAPVVAIWLKLPPFVERSILNPVSLPELSDQARSIRERERAVAERLLGLAGAVPVDGVTVM
jgi:hypothetical protein